MRWSFHPSLWSNLMHVRVSFSRFDSLLFATTISQKSASLFERGPHPRKEQSRSRKPTSSMTASNQTQSPPRGVVFHSSAPLAKEKFSYIQRASHANNLMFQALPSTQWLNEARRHQGHGLHGRASSDGVGCRNHRSEREVVVVWLLKCGVAFKQRHLG